MKEMKYKNERSTEVLSKGIENGIDYIIISLGTHPCCYIGISKDHPLAGFEYTALPLVVHGGLTFSDYGDGEYLPEGYYWYGWDYAHSGDYSGYDSLTMDGKKYTTEELKDEVRDAIWDFKDLKELAERIYMKDRD